MLLHDKLQGRRLILASQSPRRRELLAGSGLPFVLAEPYACEERYDSSLTVYEVPRYLSRLKSTAYPQPLDPGDILLTADTVVISEEEVLGKPRSRADARRMLQQLSNRQHTVITGVTLRSNEACETFGARSDVWFRRLTREEITYYLDHYRPYDKAGSYGVQEWIGYVAIERINGSFYNVMGLPVQQVYTALNRFLDRKG